jgi:hypothetical protein
MSTAERSLDTLLTPDAVGSVRPNVGIPPLAPGVVDRPRVMDALDERLLQHRLVQVIGGP